MTKPFDGTPFDLSGKVAIVSGACGLLGREFSIALASAGAKVALLDANKQGFESLKEWILKEIPECKIITQFCDVTDMGSVEQAVGQVLSHFDHIDVLVNSAAIDPKFEPGSDSSSFSKFAQFPKRLWEESLQVNLTGTFLLTQSVCRHLEHSKKGSIINLGSSYGICGPDQRIYVKESELKQAFFKPAVYSVAKAGILGFTKYLAAYYAGTSIRVNTLSPAGVYNNNDPEFVQKYSDRTILRRMSYPHEYRGPLLFLASDASSYMTGANLVVDGGWSTL